MPEIFDVKVVHPRRGSVIVRAVCKTDALLQAAIRWDCSFLELRSAKIGIRPEDRERWEAAKAGV